VEGFEAVAVRVKGEQDTCPLVERDRLVNSSPKLPVKRPILAEHSPCSRCERGVETVESALEVALGASEVSQRPSSLGKAAEGLDLKASSARSGGRQAVGQEERLARPGDGMSRRGRESHETLHEKQAGEVFAVKAQLAQSLGEGTRRG
jgi:hypothetical protein